MDTTPQLSAGSQSLTFPAPNAIGGSPGSHAEAPKVARAGDDAFILWHQFPDLLAAVLQPDVDIARSTNQGVTFQPRMNLSNTPTGTSDREDIAASRSGNQTRVYVVWIENTAGVTDVVFRRDRTNNGTYANPKKLNGTLGTVNARNPHVVASGDNVFVPQPTSARPHTRPSGDGERSHRDSQD